MFENLEHYFIYESQLNQEQKEVQDSFIKHY